jgi:hypothetical protein
MMPTEWLRVREGNPERREKYIYFLPPGLICDDISEFESDMPSQLPIVNA